jgi:hypothetical protein
LAYEAVDDDFACFEHLLWQSVGQCFMSLLLLFRGIGRVLSKVYFYWKTTRFGLGFEIKACCSKWSLTRSARSGFRRCGILRFSLGTNLENKFDLFRRRYELRTLQ